MNFSDDDRSIIFIELWKLLLYTASHPSASVRLSSYNLTGSVLLKLYPYFSNQIQSSFSDASMNATIDIKSSAIIASSFAFISKRIALPYLDVFLDSTPVFHHFTISDPIFTEYLSSIISNLGDLGYEWYSTLLHSLLFLTKSSNDRYLLKSIAAVIQHDPYKLFNDILVQVKEESSIRQSLALISFIITSIDEFQQNNNENKIDLFEIAKVSLEVLENPKNANMTEIDSSLQILSLNSSSFKVKIYENENAVKMTLSKMNDNNSDDITIDFNIEVFAQTPSLYLLDIPIKYSQPTKDDSMLTINAKFKSLGRHIATQPDNKELINSILLIFINFFFNETLEIFDSTECVNLFFKHNINGIEQEKFSTIIQGITQCIGTLINTADESLLKQFLKILIFRKTNNWFQHSDILDLIRHIPPVYLEKLFGLNKIIDLLVDFSLSQNEQVSSLSCNVLRDSIITDDNFQDVTLLIASKIDFFDDLNLTHILSLLSSILYKFPASSISHLRYFAIQILELYSIYCNDNAKALIEIFSFLGNFKLSFITNFYKKNPNLYIYDVFHGAVNYAKAIIASSITNLTGLPFNEWQKCDVQYDLFMNASKLVEADMKSVNIDASSENSLDYSEYLRVCISAMKFLYVAPSKVLSKKFVLTMVTYLKNIFPLKILKFLNKFWSSFNDEEKISALSQMIESTKSIQNYEVAEVVCKFFIFTYQFSNQNQLNYSKEILLVFSKFFEHNTRSSTYQQQLIFKALSCFVNHSRIDPKSNFEQEIIQYYPEIYAHLFNKLLEKEDSAKITSQKSNNSMANTSDSQGESINKFTFTNTPNLEIKLDYDNPCIKTQLKFSNSHLNIKVYHFNEDDLKNIFHEFIKTNDIYGIKLVLKQLSFQKILINFNDESHFFIDNITRNFQEEICLNFIDYLNSVNQDSLDKFIESFQININSESVSFETALFLIKLNPKQYIEKIINATKITKRELKLFARVVQILEFSENDLINATIHCFSLATTPLKFRYVVVVATSVVYKLNYINSTFSDTIVSIMDSHSNFNYSENELEENVSDDLPIFYAGFCLLFISKKTNINAGDSLKILLTKLIASISQSSAEICLLYSALMNLSLNDLVFKQNLPKILEHFFEINLPSIFMIASSLFAETLPILTAQNSKYLTLHAKKFVSEIINKITTKSSFLGTNICFSMCYPVSETISAILSDLMKYEELNRQKQTLIFQNYAQIIPEHSSPYYICYSKTLLLDFLTFAKENKKLTSDYNSLVNISRGLVVSPSSYDRLKAFISAVYVRASIDFDAPSTSLDQTNVVTDIESDAFFNDGIRICDCYGIENMVYEWLKLLLRGNGIAKVLDSISKVLLLSKARFFPIFIGTIKFLKENIKIIIDNDSTKNSLTECINQIKKLLHENSESFEILFKSPDDLEKVLDFAF